MPPQDARVAKWFEAEVKPHEDALKGYLYKQVPNRADVDDVVQETYRRILEVKRKKAIKSAKGLLFAIARNVTSDIFRKKATSQTIFLAEMEHLRDSSAEPEPSTALNSKDEAKILREAIQQLPKRCRQILISRKLENLSNKEIAKDMNISVHTVEAQLTIGLVKCKQYFKRKGLL